MSLRRRAIVIAALDCTNVSAFRIETRLPAGARLRIQVTKDGAIGVVKTLTIRRRRAPSVRTLCIPPGASGPSAC